MWEWIHRPALRIAAVYALIAGLWILYSDRLVFAISPTPQFAQTLEIIKGWFFVLVTAGLLYIAMQAEFRQRYEIEQALRRANRAYRVVSECNQALIRASNEDQLVQTVCRYIIEMGGYRMCWVGYVEHDPGKSVRPVASAGLEDGYLENLEITWADTERGQGPTGKAIRSGLPVLARDIANDPDFAPWREGALSRGYIASIAIPLITGKQTLGALNIYSMHSDAFDELEVKLLSELASDLAFGISMLRYRQAQEAIEERITYQASLLEAVQDAIIATDAEFYITSWNQGAELIYGWSSSEAVGKPVDVILRTEMQNDTLNASIDIVQNKGAWQGSVIQRHKDGSRVYIDNHTIALKDDTGRTTGYVAVNRDITERVRVEEAHRQQTELLQTIFDHIPVMINVFDNQGHPVLVNHEFERVLNWSLEELQQSSNLVAEFYPDPEEEQDVREHIARAGSIWKDFKLRLKDGRFLDTAWANVHLSDGSTIGIGQDITERKKYEETLTQSQRLLREMAARLAETEEAERKRLAQELHDRVGQLLTAISINLNVMFSSLSDKSKSGNSGRVDDTQKLVEEAAAQIRNVMAELRPPVLDDYGLVVALRWYCDLFTRRTGILTRVEGDTLEPRLPGAREDAVFRIVQEALTNVSKHAHASQVVVRVKTLAGEIVIQVQDDGKGFDPEQAPAGWGLNIMRERAIAVGGELALVSTPGEGSTVTIRVSQN